MAVRAKFYVSEIGESAQSPGNKTPSQKQVKLSVVYANSDENKSWSKWTPSGSISMCITNESALTQFAIGQEFYVDFTPVEPSKP